MDVYGKPRVRVYNTLHRAIRKSSCGPVRCNIALHLKIEHSMFFFSYGMKTNIFASCHSSCKKIAQHAYAFVATDIFQKYLTKYM